MRVRVDYWHKTGYACARRKIHQQKNVMTKKSDVNRLFFYSEGDYLNIPHSYSSQLYITYNVITDIELTISCEAVIDGNIWDWLSLLWCVFRENQGNLGYFFFTCKSFLNLFLWDTINHPRLCQNTRQTIITASFLSKQSVLSAST